MTFDEAAVEGDDTKTRETAVSMAIVQTPAVNATRDPPAVVPQPEAEWGASSGAEPRRRNVMVVAIAAALVAALLGATATWFCMRRGADGESAGESVQKTRQTE